MKYSDAANRNKQTTGGNSHALVLRFFAPEIVRRRRIANSFLPEKQLSVFAENNHEKIQKSLDPAIFFSSNEPA